MTRLLITGGSGFIGRHIVARAVADGCCAVHCAGRTRPADLPATVTWHSADLRDAAAAAALVRSVEPSHLLHGAWIATPGIYAHSPENIDWVRSTIALAEAFGEGGGQRFVGLGSSAEYGSSTFPSAEDSALLAPASVYGKAKLSAWWSIRAIAQHFDFSAAWGRIFLPFGPGDPPQRLIPSLMNALAAGQPIPTTWGEQERDFVLSTDVADMLYRLLWVEDRGAFNIGSGVATRVRDAMKLVASHFNGLELLQFGARAMAPGETMCLVADMSKTRRALGTIAPASLEQGIAAAVAAFRLASNQA